MSRNHKPLPELDIDPADIPGLVRAAHQLPDITTTVARNFGGWLVAVHAGVDGSISTGAASQFRKILRQVVDAGELNPPPTVRSRRRRRDAGHARLSLLTSGASGAGAVMAAAAGHPLAAALALASAPIILDPDESAGGGALPLAA